MDKFDAILGVALPAVFDVMKGGKSWANDELNQLEADGRVIRHRLDPDDRNIETVTIPLTWTIGDIARNPLESQQIAMVRDMGTNLINCAEDLLLGKVKKQPHKRFEFARNVCGYLTPTYTVTGQAAWYKLYCFCYRLGDL